jgi:hypothetical protein
MEQTTMMTMIEMPDSVQNEGMKLDGRVLVPSDVLLTVIRWVQDR